MKSKLIVHLDISPYERISKSIDLDLSFMEKALIPVDRPSKDADLITRAFICTPPQRIKLTDEKRMLVATELASIITKALLDAFESKDTIMGYKTKNVNL